MKLSLFLYISILDEMKIEAKGCRTIKGPSPNLPCVFPFEFKGIDHNQCIWDGDSVNGAWCSTKVDKKGKHVSGGGHWGNCAPECPFSKLPKGKIVLKVTSMKFPSILSILLLIMCLVYYVILSRTR